MQARFYGNMEWFDTDDELPGAIPESLRKARLLWEESPTRFKSQIINLLSPYLKSYFVPAGISDSEELFPNQEDSPANKVKIVDVRYKKDSYIPECRAEAWYEVEVSNLFSEIDLEAWQEDRGEFFYQAISFAWAIPKGKNKTLELSYGSHLGVECLLLQSESPENAESDKHIHDVNSETVAIRLAEANENLAKTIKEFLKEHWSDEIKNLKEVLASKGAYEIHVSADDAKILCSVLNGMGAKAEVHK